VDLVFLAESTGSFAAERVNLAAAAGTLLDAFIAGTYDWDLAIGVAHFGDFPVSPHGTPGTDVIFGVLQPVSTALATAIGTTGSIPALSGEDMPDGAVEGLYLLATGEPLPPYWTPSAPCATAGAVGAVCFRPGSQRFVLLLTDSEMHNGPPDGTYEPWSAGVAPTSGTVATYPAMIEVLLATGIRVIVIDTWTDTWGETHAQCTAVATDSGAVTTTGPASYQLDLGAGVQDLGFVLDVMAELLI
jgi:hypothetical protein